MGLMVDPRQAVRRNLYDTRAEEIRRTRKPVKKGMSSAAAALARLGGGAYEDAAAGGGGFIPGAGSGGLPRTGPVP